jgi:heterodisulfide reductase subunit C
MKLVASITSKETRQDFIKEVMQMQGGENILDCIQCGICAGSCPTRFAMDYSPMQIIKMIHLGMRDEVLSSSTIWICSSCYTCATRCPRGIDITNLMMSLRNLAIQKNAVTENETKLRFHKSFLEIISKYGRLYEPELYIKILKKSDLRSLFKSAALGLRLWRKQKLSLRIPRIKETKDLANMVEKIGKEGRL